VDIYGQAKRPDDAKAAARRMKEWLQQIKPHVSEEPALQLEFLDSTFQVVVQLFDYASPEEKRDLTVFAQTQLAVYNGNDAQLTNALPTEILGMAARYAGWAYFFASAHRDQEATEFVRKAALNGKRITDPAASADALYYVALMQLRLGDKAGYRATCKSLVEVPIGKINGKTKSRLFWTPCIGADALDDPTVPVKLAEECVAKNLLGVDPYYGVYMLGAAHYRAGQYEQAANRLKEGVANYPAEPVPGHDTMNYQQLFLAMTQWQLDQKDEARQLLAKTLPAVEKELQAPSSSWNRRATLEVLRAEAEVLIRPKVANEAVDVKPPHSPPTTNN